MTRKSPDLFNIVERDREITAIRDRLARLESEKAELEANLNRQLSAQEVGDSPPPVSDAPVTNSSSPAAKIALFRSLFRGRDDVFPKRWENPKTGKAGDAPACANEWAPRICGKPKVKCGDFPHGAFLSVTDDVIEGHLRGYHTAGVYPLLMDETCWFLAVDFDKATWRDDSAALLQACAARGIPAALERSRSGQGGHVWIFFAEPVPASVARRLGAHLVTETMERNPDIGFSSYDRFFPSHDNMPAGGFGNLIALPLQHGPRTAEKSLSGQEFRASYRSMGFPFDAESNDACASNGDCRRGPTAGTGGGVTPAPRRRGRGALGHTAFQAQAGSLHCWTLAGAHRRRAGRSDIYIPRAGLPAGLVNRLIRLAAFQNPAFYSAEAMRISTFGIPRVVACAELLSDHIALPRGCREPLEELVAGLNVDLRWRDERNAGSGIETRFLGALTKEQDTAVTALLLHDTGVLAATTGFGKTVVAAAIIAARKASTLVLVHPRQLMEQWAARMQSFLNLPKDSIGQIGGGVRKPTGVVDIAMI